MDSALRKAPIELNRFGSSSATSTRIYVLPKFYSGETASIASILY